MRGEDVQAVMEAILPRAEIEAMAVKLKVIDRARKRDLVTQVQATVIGAATPNGGCQADMLRSYLDSDAPRVARSAFYRWYDEPMEALMSELAARAMAYARSQKVDLPGPLAGVKDWLIVDSTTVKVRNALKEEFPGTGDYAAIKVHKTVSVGHGATVDYHLSRARDHDSLHLDIDDSWQGYGLLCDLGYASLARLRACLEHGVQFVIRLKDNWKPRIQHIARGEVIRTFFAGTDLDTLLEEEPFALNGKAIDADVRVGPEPDAVALRLVGVPTPKGYCFFLTNLPPRIGPLQVGDIYRIRWEVEISIKLDKAVHRLDESDAERPWSIKTMLHASLIASIITAILVHKHNWSTRPTESGQPRTQPPLHQMLVAKMLVVSCLSIARASTLRGPEAKAEWQRIADNLVHAGKDPSWRNRPSVLDQMRGWKVHGRRSKSAIVP